MLGAIVGMLEILKLGCDGLATGAGPIYLVDNAIALFYVLLADLPELRDTVILLLQLFVVVLEFGLELMDFVC